MPQTPANEAPWTGPAARGLVNCGQTVEAAPAKILRDKPPRRELPPAALAAGTSILRGYPTITVRDNHPSRANMTVTRPEDDPGRRARTS